MREIKFRAWWIKDEGEVIANPMMLDMNDILNYVDPRVPVQNGDIVLMQYTGLKDKNGKEVYEGDIVASSNGVVQGFVLYQAPEFVIKRKLKHKTWTQFILMATENQYQEIIGNIYENPELLK